MTTRDDGDVTAALSGLSSALWQIRELLDLLVYKVDVEQSLVETGRSVWLPHASTEVECLLDRMYEAELLRAIEVGPAAAALGLPEDSSLAQLVAAAPEPWGHVLAEHRQALIDATTELTESTATNRQLLDESYRAVQKTLDALAGATTGQTYTAAGASDRSRTPRLFDQIS